MISACRRFVTASVFVSALALMSVGCSSRGSISSDVTPALTSHGRTAEQDANTYARVIDNNTRTLWDDFARFFLVDKTSRLNPTVVP